MTRSDRRWRAAATYQRAATHGQVITGHASGRQGVPPKLSRQITGRLLIGVSHFDSPTFSTCTHEQLYQSAAQDIRGESMPDPTYNLNGGFKPTMKRFADLDGPDFSRPRAGRHSR